jgi:hypothetical protein
MNEAKTLIGPNPCVSIVRNDRNRSKLLHEFVEIMEKYVPAQRII